MDLLKARRKLLEMAKRDVEHLRDIRELPVDDCHQMVAVVADRLAHTIQILENDTDRLQKIIESATDFGGQPDGRRHT
jgi:hypothetical protein